MSDDEKTTVQISKIGLRKLNRLARLYRRSAPQQIEWMIDRWQEGLDKMGVVQLHPGEYEVIYQEKPE